MGILMKNGVNYSGGLIEVKPEIYSEEEREIGVWVDGKPLYQKTVIIEGTDLTNDSSNTIPHGIASVDFIQMLNGVYTFGSGEDKLPLPFADNWKPVTNSAVVIEAINSTNIRIGVGANYQQSNSPLRVWITLQYTKTTDTAGSGLWSTTGAPAHHYSQSEQIVGTWIDGKPLYQKTWNFEEGRVFPVRDTWLDTNIEAEYIDKVIHASGYRSDTNYVGIIGAGLNSSNHIVLMQGRNNEFGNFKGFTLQYTKTTD